MSGRQFNLRWHKWLNHLAAGWVAAVFSLATWASAFGQDDDPFEQQLRQQAERQLADLESKREWFEKQNIPFPTIEDILDENRQFNEDIQSRKLMEQLRRQNQKVLRHLNQMIEGSENFASVVLSPEQREELKSLHDRYHRQLQTLVGSELAGDHLDFEQLRQSERWNLVDSESQSKVRELENELRDECFVPIRFSGWWLRILG